MAAATCIVGSLTIYASIGLLAASAWLISTAALHPQIAALSVAIVGVRFFGLARAVCRYLERYLSHDVTFR
ncbi:MAG: putative multidrug export ATP-binding/permease protein, partial [Sporomusa sp.]|nr:putative multidrug export ATP-binding/permease protein [Sporomusa sp.]